VNDLLKIMLHVTRALARLIFLFCLAASLCSAQSSDAVVHGKGEFLNLLGHKIWYESSGQGRAAAADSWCGWRTRLLSSILRAPGALVPCDLL
jgi:hypothetical protein